MERVHRPCTFLSHYCPHHKCWPCRADENCELERCHKCYILWWCLDFLSFNTVVCTLTASRPPWGMDSQSTTIYFIVCAGALYTFFTYSSCHHNYRKDRTWYHIPGVPWSLYLYKYLINVYWERGRIIFFHFLFLLALQR